MRWSEAPGRAGNPLHNVQSAGTTRSSQKQPCGQKFLPIWYQLSRLGLHLYRRGLKRPQGRAPKGQEGRYMALFTMSFSLAHIGSSKSGLELIAYFGYRTNWIVMGILGLLATLACYYLMHLHQKEKLKLQK